MNTTTFAGHVGSAKLVTPKGKSPVLNISLAANRKIGDNEYTDWVSAKVWGERATKLSPHISKGTQLLVVGRPKARAYKKADGTAGAELVLHVSELEFLSAKGKPGETPEDKELPLETATA